MPEVESAYLKLRRAKQHFNAVNRALQAFLKRESHSVIREVSADGTEYVWSLRASAPFPDHWGLIVGDCVTNLRASLDHAIFATVRGKRMSEEQMRLIQFPIFEYRPKRGFNKTVERTSLLRVPRSAYAIINRLQPYNGRRSPYFLMPHPLTALRIWSNADKHKALNPVWGLIKGVTVIAPIPPIASDTVDPIVEDDALIAWARFDRPDVNVDIDLDLAVVLPLATEPISVLPMESIRGFAVKFCLN